MKTEWWYTPGEESDEVFTSSSRSLNEKGAAGDADDRARSSIAIGLVGQLGGQRACDECDGRRLPCHGASRCFAQPFPAD